MDSSNEAGFQLQKLQRALYKAIKNHVHAFTLPHSDLDPTSPGHLPQSNAIDFQRGARRQLRYFLKDMLHRRYPFFFKEEIMVQHIVSFPRPITSPHSEFSSAISDDKPPRYEAFKPQKAIEEDQIEASF